jgi:hypothetical protein
LIFVFFVVFLKIFRNSFFRHLNKALIS